MDQELENQKLEKAASVIELRLEKIPSKPEVAPPLSKMLSGWMDGVDTPQTVMTTRAPAVLKSNKC